MTLEQAFALANLSAQLGVLYAFGAAVCLALSIFFVVTGIAALFGFFSSSYRSNCMLEAYKHYRKGAYVVLRKTRYSHLWRWPHMGWSYDGKVWWEFIPFKRPRRWFPALIFEGYERTWIPGEQD